MILKAKYPSPFIKCLIVLANIKELPKKWRIEIDDTCIITDLNHLAEFEVFDVAWDWLQERNINLGEIDTSKFEFDSDGRIKWGRDYINICMTTENDSATTGHILYTQVDAYQQRNLFYIAEDEIGSALDVLLVTSDDSISIDTALEQCGYDGTLLNNEYDYNDYQAIRKENWGILNDNPPNIFYGYWYLLKYLLVE